MEYAEIEDFVFNNNAEKTSGMYLLVSGLEKEDLEMAIMTAIACGKRKDLEDAFPQFADANPENHDWLNSQFFR